MGKSLKILVKTIVIIVCVLVVVFGGLALYIACSPQPAVWLLRNQFGDEVEIQNVGNYDEIKKNVTVHKDLVYPSEDGRNTYDIYLPKRVDKDLPTVTRLLVWTTNGRRKSNIPDRSAR